MELAASEARGVTEQPAHGVTDSVGVLQHLAQDHIAAALSMHRPRRGKADEPFTEALRCCEPFRVKLWVPAGEPAGVAQVWRRLVGEGGEGHDLGAGAPPPVEDMGIDEGEGGVARER